MVRWLLANARRCQEDEELSLVMTMQADIPISARGLRVRPPNSNSLYKGVFFYAKNASAFFNKHVERSGVRSGPDA